MIFLQVRYDPCPEGGEEVTSVDWDVRIGWTLRPCGHTFQKGDLADWHAYEEYEPGEAVPAS